MHPVIASAVPLDQVAESHLQEPITTRARERRGIDFTKTPPDATDADKQEYRADPTSFANAGGGDLVFGIRKHARRWIVHGQRSWGLGLQVRGGVIGGQTAGQAFNSRGRRLARWGA